MTIAMIREEAKRAGYELRRKGAKRAYKDSLMPNGEPLLDYFHPHIRMRASEYARTKKVYRRFMKLIKSHFGRELKTESDVYRYYLLMLLEHCARELKITGDGVKVVLKMMMPLPREEWLNPRRKKCVPSKVDK